MALCINFTRTFGLYERCFGSNTSIPLWQQHSLFDRELNTSECSYKDQILHDSNYMREKAATTTVECDWHMGQAMTCYLGMHM